MCAQQDSIAPKAPQNPSLAPLERVQMNQAYPRKQIAVFARRVRCVQHLPLHHHYLTAMLGTFVQLAQHPQLLKTVHLVSFAQQAVGSQPLAAMGHTSHSSMQAPASRARLALSARLLAARRRHVLQELTARLEPGPPCCLCVHPGHFRQILRSNLLHNAKHVLLANSVAGMA